MYSYKDILNNKEPKKERTMLKNLMIFVFGCSLAFCAGVEGERRCSFINGKNKPVVCCVVECEKKCCCKCVAPCQCTKDVKINCICGENCKCK